MLRGVDFSAQWYWSQYTVIVEQHLLATLCPLIRKHYKPPPPCHLCLIRVVPPAIDVVDYLLDCRVCPTRELARVLFFPHDRAVYFGFVCADTDTGKLYRPGGLKLAAARIGLGVGRHQRRGRGRRTDRTRHFLELIRLELDKE